jgi:hypothetical protein|tara:strand:+ start:323 stop:586 length:264 start_codon:yes stop_codon:yes gene_type:complete
MKNTKTIQAKVLSALQSGQELTSAQIKSRFGAGNPQAVIQALRFNGFAIYLNDVKTTKGVVKKYRLGTASRAVIAAGYKALATKQVA